MIKKILFVAMMFGLTLAGISPVLAVDDPEDIGGSSNIECPVGLVSGMTLDDEFGVGTREITHCLKRRHKVKLLIQANKYCGKEVGGACVRPYALLNINNVIKDYETTNGMVQGQDYEIAVVVHSSGGRLLLNGNPYASYVEEQLEQGVKFYFCQNTARGMNVTTDQLIPSVEYVTAGISALADFQSNGWTYVQP